MSSNARISVNVDKEVKQNAQKILGEIGMDLTTAIDLMLRTIVREERIPFNLQTEKSYRNDAYKQFFGKRRFTISNDETNRRVNTDPRRQALQFAARICLVEVSGL